MTGLGPIAFVGFQPSGAASARSQPRHSMRFCETPGTTRLAHSPRTACTTFSDEIPGAIISITAGCGSPLTFILNANKPVTSLTSTPYGAARSLQNCAGRGGREIESDLATDFLANDPILIAPPLSIVARRIEQEPGQLAGNPRRAGTDCRLCITSAPVRFPLNIRPVSSSEFICHSIGRPNAKIARIRRRRCHSTRTLSAPDLNREPQGRHRCFVARRARQTKQSVRAPHQTAKGGTQNKPSGEIRHFERVIPARARHPRPDQGTASGCTKSLGIKTRHPGLA